MAKQSPKAPDASRGQGGHDEHSIVETDDLGYREGEEELAYERAQPDSQPEVSSEPEPDEDSSNAG